MSKTFVDTNILVYTLDKRDSAKRTRCREALRNLVAQNEAVISTQILQEFYVTATQKLSVKPAAAKSIIHTFTNMEVVTITTGLIKEAIDTSVQHRISFWDALVVVAAESARCEFLLSEDLNSGQIMRNVRIVNPLR